MEKIFNHPVGHNIQWHDVLSLLHSVATVTEQAGGRYTVSFGSETETFDSPRHHDVDELQVVDLRRMLRGAGITPKSNGDLDPQNELAQLLTDRLSQNVHSVSPGA